MRDELYAQPSFMAVCANSAPKPTSCGHTNNDSGLTYNNYYDVPTAPFSAMNDPHTRRVETIGHIVKPLKPVQSAPKALNAKLVEKKEENRTEHLHGIQEKDCKCTNSCLHRPLPVLRFISDMFVGTSKEEVNDKIAHYFSQSEVSAKSDSSHQFNFKCYEFKFVFYLCPFALMSIIGVGHERIIALLDPATRHREPPQKGTAHHKKTIKDYVVDWFEVFVRPTLSTDDEHPNRLYAYDFADSNAAWDHFHEWLNQEQHMTCSLSSFSTYIRELYCDVQFGQSCHCTKCYDLREAYRKNPSDKAAALALKLHQQRGHEIQALDLLLLILLVQAENFGRRARKSPSEYPCLIFDYAAHKFVPEPPNGSKSAIFKQWRGRYGFKGMSRIMLRFAGIFDYGNDSSAYYVHSHYTETSNSIVTSLHLYLQELLKDRRCKELTLFLDNKITGKCALVWAYLEWLVRTGVVPLVNVFYFLVDHSVNLKDRTNSQFSDLYRSTGSWLATPTQVVQGINNLKNSRAEIMIPFDFHSFLRTNSSFVHTVGCEISDIHLVRVSQSGCSFKLFYDDEKWRGPYRLLSELPNALLPSLQKTFEALGETTIQHVTEFFEERKSGFDAETSQYYSAVLRGETGLTNYPTALRLIPASTQCNVLAEINRQEEKNDSSSNLNKNEDIDVAVDNYVIVNGHKEYKKGLLVEPRSSSGNSNSNSNNNNSSNNNNNSSNSSNNNNNNSARADNLNVRMRKLDSGDDVDEAPDKSHSRYRILLASERTTKDGNKIPVYNISNYPEVGIDSWLDCEQIEKVPEIKFLLNEYSIVNNFKEIRAKVKKKQQLESSEKNKRGDENSRPKKKKKKEKEKEKEKKKKQQELPQLREKSTKKKKKKKKTNSASESDDSEQEEVSASVLSVSNKSESEQSGDILRRTRSSCEKNRKNDKNLEFELNENVKLEFSYGVSHEYRECFGKVCQIKLKHEEKRYRVAFNDGDKKNGKKWWRGCYLFKVTEEIPKASKKRGFDHELEINMHF